MRQQEVFETLTGRMAQTFHTLRHVRCHVARTVVAMLGEVAEQIRIRAPALQEPLRLECEHFLSLLRGEGDRLQAARDGLAVVRSLEQLQASLEPERV